MKRDFLSILDVTPSEAEELLQLAARLKRQDPATGYPQVLTGRSAALVFEKPSLRTRVTFEVAVAQLGGNAIHLAPGDIGLGQRESVADIGRNLNRWVHLIIARVFDHQTVVTLGEVTDIPVVNALSDREHPCQALADLLTVREHAPADAPARVAYVGDGNNVCHSLMLLCAAMGVHFTAGTPADYRPAADLWQRAVELGSQTGAEVRWEADPTSAVRDADFVYTDVWASMGQEDEEADRARVFADYQVNDALMQRAPAHAKVLHCLPAHRGQEISNDVIDSPRSIVLDQAENRLHAQRALLAWLHSA